MREKRFLFALPSARQYLIQLRSSTCNLPRFASALYGMLRASRARPDESMSLRECAPYLRYHPKLRAIRHSVRSALTMDVLRKDSGKYPIGTECAAAAWGYFSSP